MLVRFAASCVHAYAEPLVPHLRQLLLLRNLPFAQYSLAGSQLTGLIPHSLTLEGEKKKLVNKKNFILLAAHEGSFFKSFTSFSYSSEF